MSATLIIANRGASRTAPENTLPAIERALALGAEMVALDVQFTKDAEPVVFADTKLDRTTNASGRLAQFTKKELQELDAGSWFSPDFEKTRVPGLDEALAALGAKARLMLLLPGLRAGTPQAEKVRKALQARREPAGDVLVFGDSESLLSFRPAADGFAYALALDEKVEGWVHVQKAEKLGLNLIRPHRKQAVASVVRRAHEKKVQVFVHFADEEEELRELLGLRVDGIVTGRPERLKKLLAEVRA